MSALNRVSGGERRQAVLHGPAEEVQHAHLERAALRVLAECDVDRRDGVGRDTTAPAVPPDVGAELLPDPLDVQHVLPHDQFREALDDLDRRARSLRPLR